MELSTEVIQARVLEDFEIQLKEFHKHCETEHMDMFRKRIVNGDVNLDDPNYRQICNEEARVYKNKVKNETYTFVRSYVNTAFDVVDDSLQEGIFTKDEASAAHNTLRHILIAAEIEHDKER
jgi:hypothetical protein